MGANDILKTAQLQLQLQPSCLEMINLTQVAHAVVK